MHTLAPARLYVPEGHTLAGVLEAVLPAGHAYPGEHMPSQVRATEPPMPQYPAPHRAVHRAVSRADVDPYLVCHTLRGRGGGGVEGSHSHAMCETMRPMW